MITMHERSVPLAGPGNFRDLGGYTTADGSVTRWRRVFRSDALHQLTGDDILTLDGLGVRVAMAIDLRSPAELAASGIGLACEHGARHVHVPMMREVGNRDTTGATATEFYLTRLAEGRECITGVFEALADDAAYPAVFYCAAGKDRTGIVAAVLLRALGVADADIVADYALTQPMAPERRAARMRELGWADEMPAIDQSLYEARPETMAGFLAGMDEGYGSVTGYLEFAGVSASTVAAVRAHLLA